MKEYFLLQYKMTNRRFTEAGVKPIFAYLILTIVFVLLSIYLFQKSKFAAYAYLLFALTLICKLSESGRNEFLKICFGNTKLKKIRITENFICTLPFLLFLIFKQHFIVAILLCLSSTIIALVNFKTNLPFTIWTPFSKRPFEFTIGFRNSFYLLFLAYALTVVAIVVNNFNLGAFSMLLVFITTLSYYTKTENEYYIWSFNLNAKDFLISKINAAIQFSTCLVLPITLVLSVFYPAQIFLLMLLFLVGWSFLIAVLLSKYASFPGEINITQAVFLALCIWFPPILIVVIPYLFKKSKNNLSSLLK